MEGLIEQVSDFDELRAVNRLSGRLGGDEFVGFEEMGGGDVQGIHRADTAAPSLVPGALQDQPYVIEHCGALEVFDVETIFLAPMVEERLRANLVADKRTAQEDTVRLIQQIKCYVLEGR